MDYETNTPSESLTSGAGLNSYHRFIGWKVGLTSEPELGPGAEGSADGAVYKNGNVIAGLAVWRCRKPQDISKAPDTKCGLLLLDPHMGHYAIASSDLLGNTNPWQQSPSCPLTCGKPNGRSDTTSCGHARRLTLPSSYRTLCRQCHMLQTMAISPW